ncbi:unnamed protein product [Gordionus sp. m RMFG-2023]
MVRNILCKPRISYNGQEKESKKSKYKNNIFKIHLYTGETLEYDLPRLVQQCEESLKFPIYSEDICRDIAKNLGIGTHCFYLFALHIPSHLLWISPCQNLLSPQFLSFDNIIPPLVTHNQVIAINNQIVKPKNFKHTNKKKLDIYFRLRFLPTSLYHLMNLDLVAFNYLFQQVRYDFVHSLIANVASLKISDCLGLAVTDILRLRQHHNQSIYNLNVSTDNNHAKHQIFQKSSSLSSSGDSKEHIEDYKDFIPVDLFGSPYNRLRLLISGKKALKNALTSFNYELQDNHHNNYFYEEKYLETLLKVPEYFLEKYECLLYGANKNIEQKGTVYLEHTDERALKFKPDHAKTSCINLCNVSQLCFITINSVNSIEISRKNGIPLYLKFGSQLYLQSFVSLLDGYYRLSQKFTFNLCTDCYSPLLQKLKSLNCHGPVDDRFVLRKLKEKSRNRPGSFMIRQSCTFDRYQLDISAGPGSTERNKSIILINEKPDFLKPKIKLKKDSSTYSYLPSTSAHFNCSQRPSLLQSNSSEYSKIGSISPTEVTNGVPDFDVQNAQSEKPLKKVNSPSVEGINHRNSLFLNDTLSSQVAPTKQALTTKEVLPIVTTDCAISTNVETLSSPATQISNGYFITTDGRKSILHPDSIHTDYSMSSVGIFYPKKLEPFPLTNHVSSPTTTATQQDFWRFENSNLKFTSLKRLLTYYSSRQCREIKFSHCLPPSDYDTTPNLYICKPCIKCPSASFDQRNSGLTFDNDDDYLHPNALSTKFSNCQVMCITLSDLTFPSIDHKRTDSLHNGHNDACILSNLDPPRVDNEGPVKIKEGFESDSPDYISMQREYSRNTIVDKFVKSSDSLIPGVYWNRDKYNRIPVSVKCIAPLSDQTNSKKSNKDQDLSQLLKMMNSYAFLNDPTIVKIYAICLHPLMVVTEPMPLGPWDIYLQSHASTLDICELLEACSSISKALWYLEEIKLPHGQIRPANIYVYPKNDTNTSSSFNTALCSGSGKFGIKLSDPLIVSSSASTNCRRDYKAGENDTGSKQTKNTEIPLKNIASSSLPYIPPEQFSRTFLLKNHPSHTSDVWAFGTTIWETLNFARVDPYIELLPKTSMEKGNGEIRERSFKRRIIEGKRLPQPKNCPDQLYYVMLKCWNKDINLRIKIQELVRDVHQIFYSVLNSRVKTLKNGLHLFDNQIGPNIAFFPRDYSFADQSNTYDTLLGEEFLLVDPVTSKKDGDGDYVYSPKKVEFILGGNTNNDTTVNSKKKMQNDRKFMIESKESGERSCGQMTSPSYFNPSIPCSEDNYVFDHHFYAMNPMIESDAHLTSLSLDTIQRGFGHANDDIYIYQPRPRFSFGKKNCFRERSFSNNTNNNTQQRKFSTNSTNSSDIDNNYLLDDQELLLSLYHPSPKRPSSLLPLKRISSRNLRCRSSKLGKPLIGLEMKVIIPDDLGGEQYNDDNSSLNMTESTYVFDYRSPLPKNDESFESKLKAHGSLTQNLNYLAEDQVRKDYNSYDFDKFNDFNRFESQEGHGKDSNIDDNKVGQIESLPKISKFRKTKGNGGDLETNKLNVKSIASVNKLNTTFTKTNQVATKFFQKIFSTTTTKLIKLAKLPQTLLPSIINVETCKGTPSDGSITAADGIGGYKIADSKEEMEHGRKELVYDKSINKNEIDKTGDYLGGSSVDSYSVNNIRDQWIIDEKKEIKYFRKLGEGNFGEVWLAEWNRYGLITEKVAVKSLKKQKIKMEILGDDKGNNETSSLSRQDLENEINIMKKFSFPFQNHPNIIQIKGIIINYPVKKLVMEYLQLGSLDSFLRTFHDKIDLKRKMKYIADIVNGMDYLTTTLGIVHRDLSARNVLVTDDACSVKISDFGLAKFLTVSKQSKPSKGKGVKSNIIIDSKIRNQMIEPHSELTPSYKANHQLASKEEQIIDQSKDQENCSNIDTTDQSYSSNLDIADQSTNQDENDYFYDRFKESLLLNERDSNREDNNYNYYHRKGMFYEAYYEAKSSNRELPVCWFAPECFPLQIIPFSMSRKNISVGKERGVDLKNIPKNSQSFSRGNEDRPGDKDDLLNGTVHNFDLNDNQDPYIFSHLVVTEKINSHENLPISHAHIPETQNMQSSIQELRKNSDDAEINNHNFDGDTDFLPKNMPLNKVNHSFYSGHHLDSDKDLILENYNNGYIFLDNHLNHSRVNYNLVNKLFPKDHNALLYNGYIDNATLSITDPVIDEENQYFYLSKYNHPTNTSNINFSKATNNQIPTFNKMIDSSFKNYYYYTSENRPLDRYATDSTIPTQYGDQRMLENIGEHNFSLRKTQDSKKDYIQSIDKPPQDIDPKSSPKMNQLTHAKDRKILFALNQHYIPDVLSSDHIGDNQSFQSPNKIHYYVDILSNEENQSFNSSNTSHNSKSIYIKNLQGNDNPVFKSFQLSSPIDEGYVDSDSNKKGRILFTQKSDVWSFGVTCWEIMCNGMNPLQIVLRRLVLKHFTERLKNIQKNVITANINQMELEEFLNKLTPQKFVTGLHELLIKDQWRLPRPIECPQSLYNLIVRDCWSVNPKDRFSFSKIKRNSENSRKTYISGSVKIY